MALHPVRTFFKAFGFSAVTAAMGFFLGVFLSIVGISLYGMVTHSKPDLTMSYRFVGLGLGISAFIITFCVLIYLDLREASKG